MISNFYIRFRHIILLLLISSNVYAQSTMLLTLVNNSGFYRENELVTLQRKTVERYLSRPIKFVNVSKAEKQIPVQYVDENKDGHWDQLVFLYSFTPNEQAELKVSIITKSILSPVKQLAHVRMRKKIGPEAFGPNLSNVTMPLKNPATNFSKEKLPMYLTEGPAWENDKVAFRLYFDVRNNKDIYGKVTSRMMMDTVGANTKMSYHVLSEWGMDVLHVVKSLGAGALALSVPLPAGGDTLIRLGGQNITNTVFQQVADGPLLGRLSLT